LVEARSGGDTSQEHAWAPDAGGVTDVGEAAGATPELPRFEPRQVEKQAPCQGGCPNSGDIRGWIGTVAQRHKLGLSREEAYTRAWRMITDVNPFPSVLGRVCPHPCESHCNRSEKDGSVAINAMERFLGDWAIENSIPLASLEAGRQPESIGVIGAGPSGLSFAYQMARRGYRVTVYERRAEPGGMLRHGIPDYRLPPEVLEAEIRRIVDLGVEIRLNTAIGRDVMLEELRDLHPILFLGIGAQKGRRLGVPGEEGPGVWSGTDYLDRVNHHKPVSLGEQVVVVGGGNTAVDAARTARRSGAEVTLLYRRTRAEMPATPGEVEEAIAEGVALEFLAAPVELERLNGGLETVVVQRMQLGEPDESGRRRPLPIEGSEYRVPADSLIAAVSQEPEWDGLDALDLGDHWPEADESGVVIDGVYAGGDVLGLGIAGMAIAHGRRAAEAVHARLRGLPPPPPESRETVGADNILMELHEEKPPALPLHLSPEEGLAHPEAEVSRGITETAFLEEAERCFSCGMCYGCQHCWMYCTPGCFTKVEESRPGVYFTLSLDECEKCGKCIEVCPCGFLEVS
jgi:NADPH-dependent glutamate synthase beta subunit-like oxidoreductase/Pyruvate/2-oxoacid:ferredoxin oxidoreductase delta subunit